MQQVTKEEVKAVLFDDLKKIYVPRNDKLYCYFVRGDVLYRQIESFIKPILFTSIFPFIYFYKIDYDALPSFSEFKLVQD